jgi:CheY-like chemotaxis protein
MSLTILVVDDEVADRRLIGDLLVQEPALAERSLRVLQAQDGVEALEVFQRERPDLIITDLRLPRADGFKLCHGVRDLPEGQQVPILAVSAIYKDVAIAKQLMDNFGADFLPKPVQPRRLVAKVLELIRRGPAPARRLPAVDPLSITGPTLPVTTPPRGTPAFDPLSVTGPSLPGESPPLEAIPFEPIPIEPIPLDVPLDSQPVPAAPPPPPQQRVVLPQAPSPVVLSRPMRTTLDKHPLPWLLVQAAAVSATGSLRLARGKVRRVIYLVEGCPVYVDSNLRNETLGHFMVTKRAITEEQLAEAMKEARQSSAKLGETLVRMGITDEATVQDGLLGQVRLKLLNAMRWPDGAASFLPGDDFSTRLPSCPVDAVEIALLVLKKTVGAADLRSTWAPHLDKGVRLTDLGKQFRATVERVFGTTMPSQLLSGVALRQALTRQPDEASAMVLLEALRLTGLLELAEALPGSIELETPADVDQTAAELRDIDPTIPRHKSGVMDLAELELMDPGEQTPHTSPTESGEVSIPAVQDVELESPSSAQLLPIEPQLPAPPSGEPAPAPVVLVPPAPVSPEEAAKLREALVSAYEGVHDKNFYQVLELAPDAGPGQIEDAYRQALTRFPTERFQGPELGTEADKVMELAAIAEQAYSILSDPLRRRSYDETLALAQVQPEPNPDGFGAELLFQDGETKLRQRDFEGAVAAFEGAVKAHPGQPDYHALAGRCSWPAAAARPAPWPRASTSTRRCASLRTRRKPTSSGATWSSRCTASPRPPIASPARCRRAARRAWTSSSSSRTRCCASAGCRSSSSSTAS